MFGQHVIIKEQVGFLRKEMRNSSVKKKQNEQCNHKWKREKHKQMVIQFSLYLFETEGSFKIKGKNN